MQYSASWQADFLDIAVIPSFHTASAKSGRLLEIGFGDLAGWNDGPQYRLVKVSPRQPAHILRDQARRRIGNGWIP